MSEALEGKARSAVARAILKGKLVRPTVCELCGKSTAKHELIEVKGKVFMRPETHLISAHHWNGYEPENWLNVWWVCQGCNVRLGNRHDGSLTKEQAKEFVANWSYSQRLNDYPEIEKAAVG